MAGSPKKDIPRPSSEQVTIYLKKWEQLDAYPEQEKALDKLFQEFCPKNEKIEDILLKSSTLNDFYSTNIFSVFSVAKHILELKIDARLSKKDLSLVDELQNVNIQGKNHKFYSFASKYCSHHNPKNFPIYDNYVAKVLRHFRDVDKFIKRKDLKIYKNFVETLDCFTKYYGLENFSRKEIDRYLWLLGKENFPKTNQRK